MMAGNVREYVGRTVDLLAFQMDRTAQRQEMVQSLVRGVERGRLVTGVEKLAQRFLLILLTEVESMGYLPQAGTRFLIDARFGSWRTTADIRQSFASAVLDVQRQLRQQELDSDPDEEKFASAEITGLSLTGDGVKLAIRLTSVAGDSREILTPISVVV